MVLKLLLSSHLGMSDVCAVVVMRRKLILPERLTRFVGLGSHQFGHMRISLADRAGMCDAAGRVALHSVCDRVRVAWSTSRTSCRQARGEIDTPFPARGPGA